MDRRTLLKAAAAAPLAAALPTGLAAAAKRSAWVRPGDPAWPNAAAWGELKAAAGGNLIAVRPLFEGCSNDAQSAACLEAARNHFNPFWVGDQPGGTQVSGWLDAWTPAPSAFAVAARGAADVAAAVNFARERRVRLVVKGAGHSYQGTSNGADSLMIWIRGMRRVALRPAFVPEGCIGRLEPVAAVTAEAGATWIDLYHAVTTEGGLYVQGGGCADVGVAGLVQSGGFGSFSKGFGTAAGGLLEAEVVTADGAVRLVNPCRDPDLFWALRGGGGGSFGVVTRLTLATHPLPDRFGAAWGTIKAASDDAFRALIARFVAHYAANLFNPHWGEQAHVGEDNTMTFSMASQGLDTAQSAAAWAPFYDWVKARPTDYTVVKTLGAFAFPARRYWEVAGNPAMTADSRPGAPPWQGWWKGDQDQVGAFLHGYDSLWLPAALLAPARQSDLAAALFAASRHKSVGLHFNKGLAGAPPEALAAARRTATNPAVLDAFALAIIAGGGTPAWPGMDRAPPDLAAARADARSIDAAAAVLRNLAPQSGSYVSESNYFNPRWRGDFWGANYPRLRAVKAKYDPHGLFVVHHGVGSEDANPDGAARGGRGALA